MSSIKITIQIPKTTYIGGERVEGNLRVAVPAAAGQIRIPGIVINASSHTVLTKGKGSDGAGKGKDSNIVEPYRQQLRVTMPKGGAKEITLAPGSSTDYPFALILPPDLLPSYYCAAERESDGMRFVASLTYRLSADLAAKSAVKVSTDPIEIQIVPVALPYGPQPRKGYVISVYDGFTEPTEDGTDRSDSAAAHKAATHGPDSNGNGKAAADTTAADPKKKSSAGCGGGGGGAGKNNSSSAQGAKSSRGKGGQKQALSRKGAVPVGKVKAALTMQSAYICLRPNVSGGKDGASAEDEMNSTMWVEVRLSNMMKNQILPFIVRVTLKLITVFKPTDGSDPVENTLILASRTARGIASSKGGDETVQLKPNEGTPMRISLAVPQHLSLGPCGAAKIHKADAEDDQEPTVVPVPPTIDSPTFDARTVLEVALLSLEHRTMNNEYIIRLEDPVEIVGLPNMD